MNLIDIYWCQLSKYLLEMIKKKNIYIYTYLLVHFNSYSDLKMDLFKR